MHHGSSCSWVWWDVGEARQTEAAWRPAPGAVARPRRSAPGRSAERHRSLTRPLTHTPGVDPTRRRAHIPYSAHMQRNFGLRFACRRKIPKNAGFLLPQTWNRAYSGRQRVSPRYLAAPCPGPVPPSHTHRESTRSPQRRPTPTPSASPLQERGPVIRYRTPPCAGLSAPPRPHSAPAHAAATLVRRAPPQASGLSPHDLSHGSASRRRSAVSASALSFRSRLFGRVASSHATHDGGRFRFTSIFV